MEETPISIAMNQQALVVTPCMAPPIKTTWNLPEVTATAQNTFGEGVVFRKVNVGDILKAKSQVSWCMASGMKCIDRPEE
jgi:hypothetical protein